MKLLFILMLAFSLSHADELISKNGVKYKNVKIWDYNEDYVELNYLVGDSTGLKASLVEKNSIVEINILPYDPGTVFSHEKVKLSEEEKNKFMVVNNGNIRKNPDTMISAATKGKREQQDSISDNYTEYHEKTVGDNLIQAGKYQYIAIGLQFGGAALILLNPTSPAIGGLVAFAGSVVHLMAPYELIKAGKELNRRENDDN